MPKTKWLGFSFAIEFVKKNYSEEGFRRVIETLSPGDRMVLIDNILPVSWRPMSVLSNFLRATQKVLGGGKSKILVEAGRFSAEHIITRFYRDVIRMTSPSMVIEKIGELWGDFHDTGDVEISLVTENLAVIKIIGHEGGNRAFCHFSAGFFEKTLEMAGALQPKVTIQKCEYTGDDCCEYALIWQ
ncbi:MAG: hypothetical protein ABH868_00400 [bacterium]